MYVDDATEIVSDNCIINILTRTQKRVDRNTDWLLDNGMVVAPHKSKFLLACSKELRNARLSGQNHFIKVENKVVWETKIEKLLGIYMDHDLTWKTYLWGEHWRDENNWPGLIPNSQRWRV